MAANWRKFRNEVKVLPDFIYPSSSRNPAKSDKARHSKAKKQSSPSSASRPEHWIPRSGPLAAPKEEDDSWIPSSGPLLPRSHKASASSKPRRSFEAARAVKTTAESWIPMSGPLAAPKEEEEDSWIPSSGPLVRRSRSHRASTSSKPRRSFEVKRKAAASRPKRQVSKKKAWCPLEDNWEEVLETVLSKDLDNLVDLEEFFGYYFLLRNEVYRELVEQMFKDFCNDFTLPLASLMVPSHLQQQQQQRNCDSSEGELECLPPSPCSRVTLAWFNDMANA